MVEFREPQKIKLRIAILTHAVYILKKSHPLGLLCSIGSLPQWTNWLA